MKDPMLDEEFLHKLDQYPHKFLWAKIISLNFEEFPMEEITGKITGGSINIDGNSAVRLTCSLTMVANDVDINNFYWSLNTKFRVEIGLENWIDSSYPDIIWFKQGMFLISSFNCSVGTNNYTINIQGKDKMVLLNGEVGGVVPASWDFGKIDVTNDDGTVTQDFYPIKDIILQAVHEYAQEPWSNIIVNDLDDYGIELLEYMGESPLYYIIGEPDSGDNNSREIYQMTMDGDMDCYARLDYWENGERKIGNQYFPTTISQLENIPESAHSSAAGTLCYEKLIEQLDPSGNATETIDYMPVKIAFSTASGAPIYTVAKITKDNGMQVCGYRICDIVYPYDLIASPGEALTSILDKLVKMLGNFEYFYDVEGRFIFQKKKTFTEVSYNNIVNEHSINSEVWADSSQYNSKYSYTFDKNYLVSSIQNSPNLSNLKNDFSLWGERKQGDITVPIHMRYAIDHKPMWYKVIGHHIQRNKKGLAYNENDGTNNNFERTDLEYIDKGTGKIIKDPMYKQVSVDKNTYAPEKYYYLVGDTYVLDTSQEFDEEEEKIYYLPLTEVYDDAEAIFYTKEGLEYVNSRRKEEGLDSIEFTKNDKAYLVDWREIIYQMANDYRRHYREEDFLIKVRDNNMITNYDSLYPKGYTGYEKYYIDFEMNLSQGVVAYWREIYNYEQAGKEGRYLSNGNFERVDNKNTPVWDEHTVYAKDVLVRYGGKVYRSTENGNNTQPEARENHWSEFLSEFRYNKSGWNPDVLDNPEALNFWFDFLDTTGDLNKYTVSNIGQRTKATNDTTIKAIYFRETPNVIFYLTEDEKEKSKRKFLSKWIKPGYSYIHIPAGLDNLFAISSRGKNAMDVIDEYLYSYTYPASAVNLNTIPIFYLSPNTLIYVEDKDTGIIGEYIAQKFSFQFGTTAQMTINAVQTAKRLY